MTIAQRINDLKKRSSPINYRYTAIDERGKLVGIDPAADLEKRIVSGYALVWGSRNKHGEVFLKGCCAKSIQERGPQSNSKYKMLFDWMHDPTDPLGTFIEIVEDDYGLRFRTNALDEVPNADRCIKQVRSGTLNQFSVGFNFVWDKIDYDETTDSLILKEIDLMTISPVSRGSECETYAFRSAEKESALNDEIEDFILSLDRRNRLQARTMFAKQKALIEAGPGTSQDIQPPAKRQGINYNYLLKNL